MNIVHEELDDGHAEENVVGLQQEECQGHFVWGGDKVRMKNKENRSLLFSNDDQFQGLDKEGKKGKQSKKDA